jgi:hypothetical protein
MHRPWRTRQPRSHAPSSRSSCVPGGRSSARPTSGCRRGPAAARNAVARFRLDAARAADRREFDALAVELARVSPEFARLWSAYDVTEVIEGLKDFVHPELGVIGFEHVALLHVEPDGRELRVSLYAPQPGPSTDRARQLFGIAPSAARPVTPVGRGTARTRSAPASIKE